MLFDKSSGSFLCATEGTRLLRVTERNSRWVAIEMKLAKSATSMPPGTVIFVPTITRKKLYASLPANSVRCRTDDGLAESLSTCGTERIRRDVSLHRGHLRRISPTINEATYTTRNTKNRILAISAPHVAMIVSTPDQSFSLRYTPGPLPTGRGCSISSEPFPCI